MKTTQGYTPLALACQLGAVEIVEYLLKKGANPNKFIRQMTDCFYVIHVACKGGNIDVITLLEKYNVKMEVKTTFDEEVCEVFGMLFFSYSILSHSRHRSILLLKNDNMKSLNIYWRWE